MKRSICFVLLMTVVAVISSGCFSATYIRTDKRDGKEVTEFGLVGFPEQSDVRGLLPLWRDVRPVEKEEQD